MKTKTKQAGTRKWKPAHTWITIGAILALAAMVVVLLSETVA